jgi:inner membrane protein
MLFWHLGAGLWLFRWIFRDPKVDVRLLLFGLILPDLIDLPLGTAALADHYSTGELWAHSLILPWSYMVVVLLMTRRGRRRRAYMALGVGWLFHLLLDGMWVDPEVLFWPFFGDIPTGETPFWPLAWGRAMADPWRWVKEAVAIGYLVWLWMSVGLRSSERRRALIATGRLPDHVVDQA